MRKSMYPWEAWFERAKSSGMPTIVVHGKDYQCRTITMAVRARVIARQLGYSSATVLTQSDPDRFEIYVG